MAALLGGAPHLAAQQTPGTLTLTGAVVDAATGAPVAGAFVSTWEQGPRAIADAEGRFRLANLPAGTHRVVVQGFGYLEVALSVAVNDSTPPLLVRMDADPVAIDGLTVTGGARIALSGVVLDAATDEPIPWASLWLTRDAVRGEGSGDTDRGGVFRLPEVATGEYLLRVERLGYVSQFVIVHAAAPPEPLELRLEPDTLVVPGLESMNRQIRNRRNATAVSTMGFGEERLRTSHARGMRQFLLEDIVLNLVPCENTRGGAHDECLLMRGSPRPVAVFIDERLVFGIHQLDSYHPSEFYQIEVLMCLRPVIRAYTYMFMDRVGRRPQQLLDPCDIPRIPG